MDALTLPPLNTESYLLGESIPIKRREAPS